MKVAATPLSVPLGISSRAASATGYVLIVHSGSNPVCMQRDSVAMTVTGRDAKDSMNETWPHVANFGFLAFDQRHESDCIDIELGIPPAPLDHPAFLTAINAIEAPSQTAQTTLTRAVRQAAKTLPDDACENEIRFLEPGNQSVPGHVVIPVGE